MLRRAKFSSYECVKQLRRRINFDTYKIKQRESYKKKLLPLFCSVFPSALQKKMEAKKGV